MHGVSGKNHAVFELGENLLLRKGTCWLIQNKKIYGSWANKHRQHGRPKERAKSSQYAVYPFQIASCFSGLFCFFSRVQCFQSNLRLIMFTTLHKLIGLPLRDRQTLANSTSEVDVHAGPCVYSTKGLRFEQYARTMLFLNVFDHNCVSSCQICTTRVVRTGSCTEDAFKHHNVRADVWTQNSMGWPQA